MKEANHGNIFSHLIFLIFPIDFNSMHIKETELSDIYTSIIKFLDTIDLYLREKKTMVNVTFTVTHFHLDI